MNKSIIADIPVTFGGVSIGKSTAKLSLKVNRDKISLELADELFCERRLTGKIQLGGHDDGSLWIIEHPRKNYEQTERR